jgi:hypothetical protein
MENMRFQEESEESRAFPYPKCKLTESNAYSSSLVVNQLAKRLLAGLKGKYTSGCGVKSKSRWDPYT